MPGKATSVIGPRNLTVSVILAISMALAAPAAISNAGDIAISVDDLVIQTREFDVIFQDAVRRRYFHGKVPDAELRQFRERVARDIVTQVLVYRDAQARGLRPDHDRIAKEIDQFDSRQAAQSGWPLKREQVLADLTLRLERLDLLQQMESQIRRSPHPSADRVRSYYLDHPEKFTEPEKILASAILLQVAPSAGEPAWSKSETLAKRLKARIDEGSDFAALARQYSGHASAQQGGQLGYLHRGQLDPAIERQVDLLSIGDTTPPLRVLEGVLLLRLEGVEPARLQPFITVRDRAEALLYRQLQEQAWEKYVRDIEAGARIYVDENLYVRSNHE